MERVFKPLVLETKEQLKKALRDGKMKTSKYNLLNDEEKMFVELLVFGDYTAEQAMKIVKPADKNSRYAANRMLSNKNVADTIEELSVQKDAKFMSELSSVRDLALHKVKYIMCTTSDESLAAACAKMILENASKIMLDNAKKSSAKEGVSDIQFRITVDNVVVNPRAEAESINPSGVVEVEVDSDDIVGEVVEDEASALPEPTEAVEANETGMPYTLVYEGINNYGNQDD